MEGERFGDHEGRAAVALEAKDLQVQPIIPLA